MLFYSFFCLCVVCLHSRDLLRCEDSPSPLGVYRRVTNKKWMKNLAKEPHASLLIYGRQGQAWLPKFSHYSWFLMCIVCPATPQDTTSLMEMTSGAAMLHEVHAAWQWHTHAVPSILHIRFTTKPQHTTLSLLNGRCINFFFNINTEHPLHKAILASTAAS